MRCADWCEWGPHSAYFPSNFGADFLPQARGRGEERVYKVRSGLVGYGPALIGSAVFSFQRKRERSYWRVQWYG